MSLPDYGPPAHTTGCAVIDRSPTAPTNRRPCGETAAWHIVWDLAPDRTARTTLVCDAHMVTVQAQFAYTGRHPVGDDCLRAGADWRGDSCTAPDDAPLLDQVERPSPTLAVQRLTEAAMFMLHPDLRDGETPTA